MTETIMPISGETLLNLGKRCNAVYVCPKDSSGHRQGSLVAYAGKDSKGQNLVGDIYFNFRRIEVHPMAVHAFARAAYYKLQTQGLLDSFDTVCGIPQGGRSFGQMLALVTGKRFAYVDKKPKPTEPRKKQEYAWDLSQFDFEPGERVAVAEDVFNNFQNTDNTLMTLEDTGVVVTLLVGALNRSPKYGESYTPRYGALPRALPVVASIREAYPEYEQDDPEVAADVVAGLVEFEVKKNWPRLMAMSA